METHKIRLLKVMVASLQFNDCCYEMHSGIMITPPLASLRSRDTTPQASMPPEAPKDAPKPYLTITSFLLEAKAFAISEMHHPANRIVEKGLTASLLEDIHVSISSS